MKYKSFGVSALRSVFALVSVSTGLNVTGAQMRTFEGAKAGEDREISGMKFCWAPPGSFRMGSRLSEPERRDDEGPVAVTLSRGFWVGKYEVTQEQWTALMSSLPRQPDRGVGGDFPVYWVNFPEAEEFCRRLTARSRAAGALPKNWQIRIPTEAQWEYACRAGTATPTSFGDRLTAGDANIGSPYPGGVTTNWMGRASKVGRYAANAWGLHDMHGNVWEWCRDWYHRQLPGGTDPDLVTEKGERNRDGTYSRVRRGGAWIEQGWACRSAVRLRFEPERRTDHIGFRVVAVRP
jgi:formylglycine-generating enzyme required for sulfatase activity